MFIPIPNDPHLLIVWLISALIKIAVTALIIFLIVRAVRYLKRKEEREIARDQRAAQEAIDEIERELNDRKE